MPLNDNGRNACLTGGLGNAATHISVHSGIPSDAGSLELTGGTYARVAVAWAAAASGKRDNSGALTHEIPASSTAAAYGLWSALTAGTFYGWLPRNGSLADAKMGFFSTDPTLTNDAVLSAAHGLANTNRVALFNVFAESLPAGLAEGTLYYVVSAATDSFKVSLTEGGAAVDITGLGEGFFMRLTPEVFASAGQLTTAIGALVLDATGI